MAETAGDEPRAADLLLASAEAALRQGAISSASASAERVLSTNPGPERVLRAQEILLDASVLAGNLPRASEIGVTLLARLDAAAATPQRRAEVHLRLAESSVAATDWPLAEDHLSRAAALAPSADEWLAARSHLLRARTALGRHQVEAAADDTRVALEIAERRQLDDVLGESLELMGRVHRVLNMVEAERWFTQALVAAERTGSRLAEVRALFELGTIDMLRVGSADRLRAARDRAIETGAPALAAQASLHLGMLLYFRFDLDEARAAAGEAHDAATRYQLGLLIPAAVTVVGAIDAVAGRRADAIAVFERIRPLMDVEVEASGRGHMLGLAALAVDDRAGALT